MFLEQNYHQSSVDNDSELILRFEKYKQKNKNDFDY